MLPYFVAALLASVAVLSSAHSKGDSWVAYRNALDPALLESVTSWSHPLKPKPQPKTVLYPFTHSNLFFSTMFSVTD